MIICSTRHGGARTLSRTTDTYLECAFVCVVPKIAEMPTVSGHRSSLPPPGGGGPYGPEVPPRGPPRRRPPMNPGDPMGGGGVPGGSSTLPMAVRRRDEVDGRTASQRQAANGAKDCFIIPQGNLERFLPDGITVSQSQISNFFSATALRN